MKYILILKQIGLRLCKIGNIKQSHHFDIQNKFVQKYSSIFYFPLKVYEIIYIYLYL